MLTINWSEHIKHPRFKKFGTSDVNLLKLNPHKVQQTINTHLDRLLASWRLTIRRLWLIFISICSFFDLCNFNLFLFDHLGTCDQYYAIVIDAHFHLNFQSFSVGAGSYLVYFPSTYKNFIFNL